MKNCYLILLLQISYWMGFAQARYNVPVFVQSSRIQNIVYGNAPELTTIYINESTTTNKTLRYDLIIPTGDTLSKRPMIILAHGGGFISGNKNHDDIQALCDSFAVRGFVTASIEYRLGMNILSALSAERAVYRGAQDFSAMIRYVKANAQQLGVDTNYIFIGGSSAGSFAALHCAMMQHGFRPPSTFASGGLFSAPDLGCINCSGNNYPSNGRVNAVVNFWGAIGDTSWIIPGEQTGLISFHGDNDLIVPYNTGFPFSALATLPMVYGSAPISQRVHNLGMNYEFHPYSGEGHEFWGALNGTWTTGPNALFSEVILKTTNFIYPYLKPEPMTVHYPLNLCIGELATYQITPQAGSRYHWIVDNSGIITEAAADSSWIKVNWQSTGTKVLKIRETNRIQAVGDWQEVVTEVRDLPVVNLGEDREICSGQSITLIPGHSGISCEWTWNGGQSSNCVLNISPTTDQIYVFQSFDGFCSNSDTITIFVNPIPHPTLTQNGNFLVTESGMSDYLWTYNGAQASWSDSNEIEILLPGEYCVSYTNAKNCASSTTCKKIDLMTVLEKNQDIIRVFPNPSSDGTWIISGIKEPTKITIWDINGKVQSFEFESSTILRLKNPTPGIYFLNISSTELRKAFRLVVN